MPRIVDENALRYRAEQLRAAGLDARGIAVVLGLDFDVRVSTMAVNHLLTTGELKGSLQKAVAS